MLKRVSVLAVLLLGSTAFTSGVEAKCYADSSGGGQTCETITPPRVTPGAGTNVTVATGGTAVILVTGPVNGGYIVNPPHASAEGLSTAENAYIDPVATPGSTDSAANGTTSILRPGQRYDVPPLATGQVIKGNAATSGHKLTVVVGQ